MPFRFRHPHAKDAAMLLDWRTRPDVTRYMFTDIADPSEERQRAWLAAMDTRDDYRHFVIEAEGRPIGYASYNGIDWINRHCSSGLYVGDPVDRRRYAGFLAPFIHDYCFYALGMEKLINEYMDGNDRLIRCQYLCGYRLVGVLKRHIWKNDSWHDVHLMELLREAYDAVPRAFSREHTLAAFEPRSEEMP